MSLFDCILVRHFCSRVRRGSLERVGNFERPSKSNVNNKLQVQFWSVMSP